jgi:ribosomal protein S18 acetylase RimI-like enzyme
MTISIRELKSADRTWLRALIEKHWGIPIVTPKAVYDAPESHDGVVAEIDGERVGVVTYVRDSSDWEVVTVIATVRGVGVGRAMLEEVRHLAGSSGASRLRLVTTDDTGASSFYERIGMMRTRTHKNFVEVVRRVKPSTGGYHDAYEFEWRVGTPS